MNGYDGPTLRSVRESRNVPLRRVARQAGMSHGHLSKVERGEPGRPVTPAVLAAYQNATGVRLIGVAGHGPGDPANGRWRRGHLSEARRRTLNAKIAAVAVGGPLGEQISRILDATGRPVPPTRVETLDVDQLEQAATLCTSLDLRLGGGVAAEMSRALLRWAVWLLETDTTDPAAAKLHAALAHLAQRAGWSAFDSDSHEVARSLFTIGLYAAERADDPDLRAHLITDLAAQHNYLGYPDDCLQVVRFAEVDERINPAVKVVISGVKARGYGLKGDPHACRRHLHLAEAAHTTHTATPAGDWRDTIATTAHLAATAGHALAALSRRTGDPGTRAEACDQLTEAIRRFDPVGQARTAALCTTQLATLHLEAGDLDQGTTHTRQALHHATGIRSARLTDHLTTLRAAAAAVPEQAAADLTGLIDHRQLTPDPAETAPAAAAPPAQ